jgi:hypothetical protein
MRSCLGVKLPPDLANGTFRIEDLRTAGLQLLRKLWKPAWATCREVIREAMESEIAAVDALKSQAIRELQELAAPEKKIVRVRVASILGSVIEKPDNPDDSEAFETRLTGRIDELQEYLLKLLAEGARIILE